jgi:hypothetical protein
MRMKTMSGTKSLMTRTKVYGREKEMVEATSNCDLISTDCARQKRRRRRKKKSSHLMRFHTQVVAPCYGIVAHPPERAGGSLIFSGQRKAGCLKYHQDHCSSQS